MPDSAARAVYLRTVRGSTPKLAATTVAGRPACQCCKISTTSITSNALLAIEPRSPRGRARRLPGQGTERVDPHPAVTDRQFRERPDEQLRERDPRLDEQLLERRQPPWTGVPYPRYGRPLVAYRYPPRRKRAG